MKQIVKYISALGFINAFFIVDKTEKDDDKNKILEILNNSFDKTSLLTRILLSTKNDFFRKMTKYSSGHVKLSDLFVKRILRLTKR